MKLADDIKAARRTFLVGNGGSAANAMHMANDLVSCGIKAYALTDIATFSCIANDYGYEHVFAHQLKIHGEQGDLLIALSGSGNSGNIVAALKQAKKQGMKSWAILGYNGGRALSLADEVLHVDGMNMQEAENFQLVIGHMVMRALKK
jgi:D-sedoheptulose 7-phosphate isomerase